MPSMLGDLFIEQWPELYTKRNSAPQINVIETDKKFKIEIAAPGMTKEDMRVELNNENQLVVMLEKEVDRDADGKECCGDEDCCCDGECCCDEEDCCCCEEDEECCCEEAAPAAEAEETDFEG